MSVHANDNSYPITYDSRLDRIVASSATFENDIVHKRNAVVVDLPQLEYDPTNDSCQIANTALIAYATQPDVRSIDDGGGAVCRLTNFSIGDDLVSRRMAVNKKDPIDVTATARHSRSYCDGFDKEFDPEKQTCHESWWEKVLSFTFLGSAFVRLARHAIAGGDRCDRMLPANESRPEIEPKRDIPNVTVRSKYHWFRDVDRDWCLPPPNVLLSDLGIETLGQIWSNEDGGRVDPVDSVAESHRRKRRDTNDDARSRGDDVTSSPLDRDRDMSRRLLSEDERHSIERDNGAKRRQRRAYWNEAYTGRIVSERRDAATNKENADDTRILDFDAIYEETLGPTGSESLKRILTGLGMTVAELSSELLLRQILHELMCSAYSRALRFVGRELTGHASRTLIALGMRTTVARITSAVLTRFSTRIMMALGTTASGVGTVLGLIELVGAILDFMLLFGWDPGNYNSEFTNDIYDDIALAGLRQRRFNETLDMDPLLFLSIFQRDREGSVVPDGSRDESIETVNDDGGSDRDEEVKLSVKSRETAPWFFARFPKALDALIRDQTNDNVGQDSRSLEYALLRDKYNGRQIRLSSDDNDDPLRRTRPLVTDNSLTTNILLSMHYFAHRETNSLGQRVDTRGDSVRLNDETLSAAVRDNELASMLSSAYTEGPVIPRSMLLAAARRNVTAKCTDRVILLSLAGGFAWALAILLATAPPSFLTGGAGGNGDDNSFGVAIAVTMTVIFFALPLLLCVTFVETIARDSTTRSFERVTAKRAVTSDGDSKNELLDVEDTDAIDRLCDTVTEGLREIIESDSENGDSTDIGSGGGGGTTFVPKFLLDFITRELRNELRVIYNVQ